VSLGQSAGKTAEDRLRRVGIRRLLRLGAKTRIFMAISLLSIVAEYKERLS